VIKCKITVLKRSFNKDYVEQYVEHERKKHSVFARYSKRDKSSLRMFLRGCRRVFAPGPGTTFINRLWVSRQTAITACGMKTKTLL
jgi:hypothetical protein